MRELQVTQQSPRSHIVVHCTRCGTSWYIDPDAHILSLEGQGRQLMAAVDHDCQEKK